MRPAMTPQLSRGTHKSVPYKSVLLNFLTQIIVNCKLLPQLPRGTHKSVPYKSVLLNFLT
jgi:hypothetical protein